MPCTRIIGGILALEIVWMGYAESWFLKAEAAFALAVIGG